MNLLEVLFGRHILLLLIYRINVMIILLFMNRIMPLFWKYYIDIKVWASIFEICPCSSSRRNISLSCLCAIKAITTLTLLFNCWKTDSVHFIEPIWALMKTSKSPHLFRRYPRFSYNWGWSGSLLILLDWNKIIICISQLSLRPLLFTEAPIIACLWLELLKGWGELSHRTDPFLSFFLIPPKLIVI